MPTSPTLPLPPSAPPSEHRVTPSAAPGTSASDSTDGFHKALGHARNGAPQDDARKAAHGGSRPPGNKAGHGDTADAAAHGKTHPSKDKKDPDAIAAVITVTPNLVLRPVVAAGTGTSLPVTVTPDASGHAGKATHAGIHTLLSRLENPAGKTLLQKTGAAQGTPGSTLQTDTTLTDAFVRAATQGREGKKDALDSIGAGRIGAGALNLQAAPTAAPAQAGAPHQLQIPSAPASPGFAQSLSQHVAWLGGQQIKQATIHLHPQDLGPLNVSVQVKHNQVDVSFAVQNPATVHSLQQTLPQLDTLLAQQGLNLGQAQVGQQHNPQQQASQGGHDGSGHPEHAESGTDIAIDAPLPPRQLAVGLVDDFA